MTDVKHCELPTCGKILERRPGEWPKQFEVRITCDRKCARGLYSWRAESLKPHRKKCGREYCDVILVQREGQTTSHFNTTKYCEDHRIIRRPELPPKICKVCGKETSMKENESHTQYEKRVTCGQFCGHKLPRPGRKGPTHKCALARCDVQIPKRRKYCTQAHCGEAQRVPPELKARKKRASDKKHNERRKTKGLRPKREKTTKIVSHAKPVQRSKGTTVFGDKEPDYIWRPAALGGPILKQQSEAS